MAGERDYYAVLGVQPTAEPDVLAAVYRALVKKYHPDVCVGRRDDAERTTKEINEAFAVLSDPSKRAEYDRVRSAPAEPEDRVRPIRDAKDGGPGFRLFALVAGGSMIVALLGLLAWHGIFGGLGASVSGQRGASDNRYLAAIPAGFVGSWIREPYGCRFRAGVLRVKISTTSIAYAGFAPLDVRSVQLVADNEVTVNVLPEPGPQDESTTGKWRLSADRNSLVIDWDQGSPEVLRRCAE